MSGRFAPRALALALTLVAALAPGGCASVTLGPIGSTRSTGAAGRGAAGPGGERERVPFSADLRAAEMRALLSTIAEAYSHLEAKQAEWHIDLARLAEKYEPMVRAADTWPAYEVAMVALVSEFHDAHLAWRRQRAPTEKRRRIARLGLSAVFVSGGVGDGPGDGAGDRPEPTLVVREVWPGSAVERAGIQVGDTLTALDGKPVAGRFRGWAALRAWSREAAARYDFGDDWAASRYDDGGTPAPRQIAWMGRDGACHDERIAPEVKPPPGRVREAALTVDRIGDLTRVRLRSLQGLIDPKGLDTLGEQLAASRGGLVFDLRDNNGGYDHQARALVSRLAARPVVGGTVRVRLTPRARAEHGEWRTLEEDPEKPGWSRALPVASEPKAVIQYNGRVSAIVDAGCRSACETLALQLRAFGARLFGETTGGSSGAPVEYAMPWSHAKVTVPAWEMFDTAGQPIEGRGLVPDEVIAPTVESLRACADLALERAVAWAAGR